MAIADFDIKYFVEVMLNLFGERNHDHLRAILRGEDVRSWGDEESEDSEVGERCVMSLFTIGSAVLERRA